MKYTLKNTAYRGETKTVEEWYMMNDLMVYFYTDKLSEAKIWDTFEKALEYTLNHKMNDHKIVEIEDKDLFEARLNGK